LIEKLGWKRSWFCPQIIYFLQGHIFHFLSSSLPLSHVLFKSLLIHNTLLTFKTVKLARQRTKHHL
jgi:hypothetical protein